MRSSPGASDNTPGTRSESQTPASSPSAATAVARPIDNRLGGATRVAGLRTRERPRTCSVAERLSGFSASGSAGEPPADGTATAAALAAIGSSARGIAPSAGTAGSVPEWLGASADAAGCSWIRETGGSTRATGSSIHAAPSSMEGVGSPEATALSSGRSYSSSPAIDGPGGTKTGSSVRAIGSSASGGSSVLATMLGSRTEGSVTCSSASPKSKRSVSVSGAASSEGDAPISTGATASYDAGRASIDPGTKS